MYSCCKFSTLIIVGVYCNVFRQMKNLEDDVCSFGFILLEALVGPSVCARKDALLLNEIVCAAILTNYRIYVQCI